MEDLLGPASRLRSRLEDRAVQLLVDAGDLSEAKPGLREVLVPAGPDPSGQQEPVQPAPDAASLSDPGEVRRRGSQGARGTEEHRVEAKPAQGEPETDPPTALAAERGERNHLINGRDP